MFQYSKKLMTKLKHTESITSKMMTMFNLDAVLLVLLLLSLQLLETKLGIDSVRKVQVQVMVRV